MNRAIFTILIMLITNFLSSAQDNPGERITESYRMETVSADEDVISRSLIAEMVNSDDRTFLRLGAWEGECRFAIEIDDRSRVYLKADGNLEWEIHLAEPALMPLVYPVAIKGLTCHYQPALRAAEIALGFFRPDSVIGSYAFYHATEQGDRRIVKGPDTVVIRYGTGKAFHIYAPYAWDMKGDTVRCSLFIDNADGLLEIHLSEEFLETAVYPVTVDPQFGKTDIGASLMLLNADYSAATRFNAPADGTLDSIVIYVDEDATAGTVGGAVYDHDGGCGGLRDSTSGTAVTGSDGWYQMETASQANIESGEDYWIAAFCGGSGFNLRYDTFSGAQTIRDYYDPWPPPDPCNNPTWNHPDRIVSIYAVYTAGEPDERRIFRRRVLLTGREGIHE